MSYSLEKLLYLQDHPRYSAFAGEVAELARKRGIEAEETKESARFYSESVAELRNSSDPIDQDAVTSIDFDFCEELHVAADIELNPSLEHPIGEAGGEMFTSWMTHASSRDVARFALWHEARHYAFQRQLIAHHDSLASESVRRAQLLVDYDIFPPLAVRRFLKAKDQYGPFKAIDFFQGGGRQIKGQVHNGQWGVMNLFSDPLRFRGISPMLDAVVFHEMLHGAAAGRGFMNGISIRTPGMNLAEEMVVSHMAAITHDGPPRLIEPTVWAPSQRDDALCYSYEGEREFAHLVHADIPVELAGASFWAAMDETEGLRVRRQYERRLDAAVEPLSLVTIASTYAAIPRPSEREQYINRITKTLYDKASHAVPNAAAASALRAIIQRIRQRQRT